MMHANRRLARRVVAALVLGAALVAGGATALDMPEHGQVVAGRTFSHLR